MLLVMSLNASPYSVGSVPVSLLFPMCKYVKEVIDVISVGIDDDKLLALICMYVVAVSDPI